MSLRIRFLAYVLLATHAACAQDVRIGVLGLFRPHEITVKTAPGQALIMQTKTVQGGGGASNWSEVLEGALQK